MLRALFSGVSGLNQNVLKLDVIGNNIANVNTVGYKSGRVNFSDALSQTLRGATLSGANRGGINPLQVGSGVQTQNVSNMFSQGNILTTGSATDLAIQGDGFFVISDGQSSFYTRAGTFEVDAMGRLVQSGTGNIVQGYAYDPDREAVSATLGALRIPSDRILPAKTTDEIQITGNLPYDSEARGTVMATGQFEDSGTGAAATSATLLTSLRRPSGTSQLLFTGDTISLDATVGGAALSGTFTVTATSTLDDLASFIETNLGLPAGNVTVTSNGEVRVEGNKDLGLDGAISQIGLSAEDPLATPRTDFNTQVSFVQTQEARNALEIVQEVIAYDTLGVAHTVRFTFQRLSDELAWTWTAEVGDANATVLSGASGRVSYLDDGTLGSFTFDDGSGELTFDPGTGASSPQTISLDPGELGGASGMTMLEAPTSIDLTQNGFPTGTFVDYSIDGSGRLFALFSNGATEVIGDLALARVNNPTSLLKQGDNLFAESSNTGNLSVRPAGEVTGTRIVVGALEQSNVDLAREFSELIITQRAFQANARVIQSSSDILAELMQLTR